MANCQRPTYSSEKRWGIMKLFRLAAIVAFVTIGTVAHAQPYIALTGARLGPCEDAVENRCNMGLVRILPEWLEAMHKYEGKTEPWTNPYDSLSESEIAGMHALRDALLARPGDPVPGAYKLPQPEFRTSDKYLESFDEAREILAADTCKTAFDVSLSYKQDSVERYAVLAFKCEMGSKVTWEYVSVAMRDSRIIRIYVNWTDKVYFNVAPKTPPAQ